MDLKIDYNKQMLNYYPEVIKSIREFQQLISTQSLEVEEMHKELTKILANAYVSTADELTIEKWEHFLGITPLPQGEDSLDRWLSDRRETILARLYKVEKLNTKSIADIVKIFTGGTTTSYFKDGILFVFINPPANSKQYKFTNVEQELSKKVPAHIRFLVNRNYYTWGQTKEDFATWDDVNSTIPNWDELLFKTVDSTR